VRRLGITGLKTTKKSRKVSTSMKSLEYLGPKYPAIKLVGEWRRRQKVLHTYCLPLIEMADRQFEIEKERLGTSSGARDLFIVRGNFKPVSVETRRLAMAEPSLLNQPIRTEIGRKVRGCYMTVAEDDPDNPNVEVLGGWDFSSQEVCVAAHVTNDPLLCSIMRDPTRKIHMETASRVFGKPISEIHEINEKIPAKTAFFGMLYGLQGPGLLDLFRSFGLEHWPLEECERLIAEIFKIYPGLLQTIRAVEKETRRTGMVRDLFGHIRYLPGIWSASRGEANEASRQAFSLVVQGTAQGITQNAMVSLREPLRPFRALGLKWTLQVHDEILLRFPRWLYGPVDRIMRDGMENGYGGPGGLRLRVPIRADSHVSTRWDQLK
jgi:DNA polymerase-1